MGLKIIMAVCLLPTLVIMFAGLYWEGRQKGNVLMGVTLWSGAADEAEVQDIVRRFRKEMIILLWTGILLFALTCIPKRDSLVLSGQMLWIIYVIIVFFIPLAKGNRRLKTLKRERMAVSGGEDAAETESHRERVYVDLKAAAEPRPKPFLKLSLAGLAVSLIPIIGELCWGKDSFYGWWAEGMLLLMFLMGILCFGLQYWFWHLSTDVISFQSEVNIQLARVRQYQWSRFWSVMLWCNTLFLFVMWYAMHQVRQGIILILAGTGLYCVAAVAAGCIAEINIRKVYRKYEKETALAVEEDDHWIYGIFYYNKNDRRFMVNKRVGIGTTINMAKTSGKVVMGIIAAGTLGLLLWAAGFMLLEEFVPISLTLEDRALVSGQYHEEYRLELSEISEAELLEELPSMSKRVGTGMESILKGSFMAESFVSCKVCVRRLEPPFVKILTNDGMTYYLNDEDPKATRQVFEKLQKALEHPQ